MAHKFRSADVTHTCCDDDKCLIESDITFYSALFISIARLKLPFCVYLLKAVSKMNKNEHSIHKKVSLFLELVYVSVLPLMKVPQKKTCTEYAAESRPSLLCISGESSDFGEDQ